MHFIWVKGLRVVSSCYSRYFTPPGLLRFPPAPLFQKRQPVSPGSFPRATGFLFPLFLPWVSVISSNRRRILFIHRLRCCFRMRIERPVPCELFLHPTGNWDGLHVSVRKVGFSGTVYLMNYPTISCGVSTGNKQNAVL